MKAKARRTRLAEERDWQRGKILDAALQAFAKGGYEGAAMNEIAAVAGFSVGHVYNVIGRKHDVYRAVVAREFSEIFVRLEAVMDERESNGVVSCVDALIDETLAFFDAHRLFFQIYLNETEGVRFSLRHLPGKGTRRRHNQLDERLQAIFRRAIERGELVDGDIADMSTAFDGLLKGFIARWADSGYPGKISDKRDVIKRFLWNGIQR